MKPWIILIVVTLATTVMASVAVPLLTGDPSSTNPGPHLTAPPAQISAEAPEVVVGDPLTYDFGIMPWETNGTHGWSFKNNGKGTLELRNLGTDCSCTIAQIGKSEDTKDNKQTMLPVAPGAEERVELTWNTRQISGGHYRKSAKIGTNDPRQPLVTLVVEGKVYPAVQVYPSDSVVSFQTVSNDQDTHRTAYIYSKDRPGLKVVQLVSQSPDQLIVQTRPMSAEELASFKVDGGLAIDMTLKPSGELGEFKYEVIIQLDHPDKPEVRLYAAGRMTGPVTLMPAQAVIHGATSMNGGSTEQIVWIRGRLNTTIDVEKAPPGIDVKFTPINSPNDSPTPGVAGTRYRMTVRVVPGTEAQQINGEILLKTDHPQATQIRVPVDAIVQSSN